MLTSTYTSTCTPPEIARALADRAEEVASALFGESSQISRHELRWGWRGSVSLRRSGPKRGFWYDHERGEGGDLLHLIARERNVRLGEAIGIAVQEFLGSGGAILRRIQRRLPPTQADKTGASANRLFAMRIWAEAQLLNGTLGARYFREHRRIDVTRLELSHALRWHGGICAVVALMTDAVSGEPTGIHRTFLEADAKKRERKMLGPQGVVRLSPNSEVTMGLGITEGLEDGLAVLLSGWAPVWAATSAGAIARFPVLAGIEALTIFADADQAGRQAAERCGEHWLAHGRAARIAAPGSLA
jgi:putative DNA primase/helicase